MDKEFIENPVEAYEKLKQECEELKDEIKTNGFGCFNIEMSEQLDQLKAEIKELKRKNARKRTGLKKKQSLISQLKAENDKLKMYITSFDYLDALSNEQVAVLYIACIDELAIRGYKAKYKTEASLLTRYHNALTEIKEIAEKFYYQELGNRDCMNCDDYCFEQILQKISEVEDEN